MFEGIPPSPYLGCKIFIPKDLRAIIPRKIVILKWLTAKIFIRNELGCRPPPHVLFPHRKRFVFFKL
jgi:hypothetical protein